MHINIPKGFLFAGRHAGIKKNGKFDLGLICGENELAAACFFTTNSFKAAPLIVSIQKLKLAKSRIQAIIVNSGNANCFTGKPGIKAVFDECAALADGLGINADLVHASSTGIIKKPLPINKIIAALPFLAESLSDTGLNDFSQAMMTTDTFAKIESTRIKIAGKTVTICGVAKGAGMIWPQVKSHATMLVYVFTDADVKSDILKKIGQGIMEKTFNSITIDGCTSTNDSVFLLASGRAENKPIAKFDKDCAAFSDGLEKVCLGLAKKIARDGEGATKLIEIQIKGAKNPKIAKAAGLAIANSFLFKTAVYGANKNLGRIVQALGQANIIDSNDDVKMYCSDLKKENVRFAIDLKKGHASWTVYTCDISEAYVKINAEYN
jgi:glutamate N-acetyltransferase / amino-acid N-acetyltransferase